MFGIFSVVAIISNAILSLILFKIGTLFVKHRELFAYIGIEKFKSNNYLENTTETDSNMSYLLNSTGRLIQFTAVMYVLITVAMSLGIHRFMGFM